MMSSPICLASGLDYVTGIRGLKQENVSVIYAASRSLYWIKGNSLNEQPFSIYFHCSRQVDTIDETMTTVYQRIITGNAHTLLKENPHGCAVGNNVGHCGNVRKNLTECRCPILSRKYHPERRKNYEDMVIDQVTRLINERKQFKNFDIRIAMLATGKLHGELCLLIRLIDTLKKKGYAGNIHVSLIDTEYASSIQESHQVAHLSQNPSFSWTQLLGHRGDFEQFLSEISLCLPSNITVDGDFFGSTDDYVFNAQYYKHDLMIGADIEGLDPILSKVNGLASRTLIPAFALVKRKEKNQLVAKLCNIAGHHEYCRAT
ncbi:MAG: hypothetical protein ACSNEK_01850 [Parachlamydiaceae bacterium]